MPTTHKKPGSKKGQPKALKRELDAEFPKRFAVAVGDRNVPALAKRVGCTRMTLWNYLNGKNKLMDALLLFALAEELKVSARWLATGRGGREVLNGKMRDLQNWVDNAEEDEKILFFAMAEKFRKAGEK